LQERLASGIRAVVKGVSGERWQDHPRVLIRAERTQRLDRLSLQRLVIAMPYTTQFNNAYYLGIKLPRLAFIKGRGCEATEV
jgi:hypothetical protein